VLVLEFLPTEETLKFSLSLFLNVRHKIQWSIDFHSKNSLIEDLVHEYIYQWKGSQSSLTIPAMDI
jgi:hypothetical protein